MHTLRPYQDEGVTQIYEHPVTVVTAPMGGGKTAITLCAISELIRDGHIGGAVVFAPKRVALHVWPDECAEWTPHLTMSCLSGRTPKQREAMLHEGSDIIVMNYEQLLWLKTLPKYLDMAVFDELTRMKNPQSGRAKAWRKLSKKRFPQRVGLTGTFTANGLMDIHGQMRALDDGARLGAAKTHFRTEHFERTGPMPWQFEPRPNAAEKVAAKLTPITFEVDPGDYLDQMPPFNTVKVKVSLGVKAQAEYDRMEAVLLAQYEGGEVAAGTSAIKKNKLRQISSGFIYDEDGEAQFLDTAKVEALEEAVEAAQGSPILVFYEFRAELEAARKIAPGEAFSDYKSDAKERDLIARWNRREVPVLYAHPASAGHGLNMQFGGNTIFWLTLPYSWELYEQGRARLPRPGTTADVINEFWACATPTDEATKNITLAGKDADHHTLVAEIKRLKNGG